MPDMLTFSQLVGEGNGEALCYTTKKHMNQWVIGASFSIHF